MKPNHDTEPDPTTQGITELQQQVDVLQRNIRRLQLEHDLLKKANKLIKKAGRHPAAPEQPGEDTAG